MPIAETLPLPLFHQQSIWGPETHLVFSRSHTLAFSLHRKNILFSCKFGAFKKAYCYCCSVAQACLTLWDPMDYSPPDSSVHGISQARILEWVAIPSSRGSSQPRDQTRVSCINSRILYYWATRKPCDEILSDEFSPPFFCIIIYVTNKTLLFSSDITEFSILYYCIIYTVYDCKPVSSAGFQVPQ